MHRIQRYVLGILLTLVTASAFAQSSPAPRGPIPAPIVHGKRVFIANLGTDMYSQDLGTKGYDAFYAAMKAWGHYQLVDAPADADLVLEFGVRSANAYNVQRFELTICDVKTGFPLWSTVEGFDYLGRHDTAEKNFARHIDHLVGMVKQLSGGTS